MARENAEQPGTAKRQDAGQRCEGADVYFLPCAVAAIPDLSPGAKILYSVLYFKTGGIDIISPGTLPADLQPWDITGSLEFDVGELARCMFTDRKTVHRWIRQLERVGLIRTVRSRPRAAHTQYYLALINSRDPGFGGFGGGLIPILPDVLERRDLNYPTQRLLLCSLSYWQGDNEWFCRRQKDIARALGLSPRTVQHCISRFRANGLIQVRARGNSRNKGNYYAVTYGNFWQAVPPDPEPVPERRWSGRRLSWPPGRRRCRL